MAGPGGGSAGTGGGRAAGTGGGRAAGSTGGQRSEAREWRGRAGGGPGSEEWRRAGVRGGRAAAAARSGVIGRRGSRERQQRAAMGARPLLRAPVSGGSVPGARGPREPALTGAVRCRAEESQQEADLPQAVQDPEEGEYRGAAGPRPWGAPGTPCPAEHGEGAGGSVSVTS